MKRIFIFIFLVLITQSLSAAFAAELSSIIPSGAAPVTVKIEAGAYTVSIDTTIPANVNLHINEGAIISIADGITLYINGPIDDCSYQIFDDQNYSTSKGAKFNGGTFSSVRPEWWGAKADGNPSSSTKNSRAIEKAMYCANSSVLFSIGEYYIERTIALKAGKTLIGLGDTRNYAASTVIRLIDNVNLSMIEEAETSGYHNTGDIVNIRFHGGNQSQIVNGINFIHANVRGVRIKNCAFTNFNGWAMYFGSDDGLVGTGRCMLENNLIDNCSNGMKLYFFDGWARNNEINVTGSYGIKFAGFDTPFQGNIIDGKGLAQYGIFVSGVNFTNISNNIIRNCQQGVYFNDCPGIFTDNIIENNLLDGVYVTRGIYNSGIITNNKVLANGRYGMNLSFGYIFTSDSFIKNNVITGNALGAINIPTIYETGKSSPIIEDNEGVDVNVSSYPVLISSATPRVDISKRWETHNNVAVTISDFKYVPKGKDIVIYFKDNFTTLKFSGSTMLKGNKGNDWKPASGDYMECKKGDDSYWYCTCYDNTP
jgi:hypothetical protein